MNDKKIYINRDDIYTGTADPNGVIKAKFKGQLYIDNQNKYYFAEDGALILDSYLLEKPEELDGDMVYTVLDIIVKHLLAEYKNIMKAIWA